MAVGSCWLSRWRGGSLCVRRRVSGWGGEWANEAARLVWLLGPAGFPEGSGEKKALVVVIAKIEQAGMRSFWGTTFITWFPPWLAKADSR